MRPERTAVPAPPAADYTCPQIVPDAPGTCPICGMALEPGRGAAEESNPELIDMTRRFWLSLIPTVPVFALSMSEMLPGHPVQRALGAAFNGIRAVS